MNSVLTNRMDIYIYIYIYIWLPTFTIKERLKLRTTRKRERAKYIFIIESSTWLSVYSGIFSGSKPPLLFHLYHLYHLYHLSMRESSNKRTHGVHLILFPFCGLPFFLPSFLSFLPLFFHFLLPSRFPPRKLTCALERKRESLRGS